MMIKNRLSKIMLISVFLAFFMPVLPAQQDTTFDRHLIKEMDDMLDMWYVKRSIANNKAILTKLKDDNTVGLNNDSVVAMRIRAMGTVIPVAYNSFVKPYIELYAVKRQRSSAILLGLAQYYYPQMQEIFDKYNVPEELIYLTIIESGLNPTAVSRAGATGIWQFMYATGKMYGLEVNTFVDDRRDPLKATDAAARHLRDLYNMFHDWGLAISAYNCGPGGVRKAIARSGNKTDFWGVRPFLPSETQKYFPAFIGAFYMMKYHQQYGITAANIAIPSNVDTVMVNHEVHFDQIAQVLNINVEEIRSLNPQYKRDIVPAYVEPFPLRLKSKDIVRFIAHQDSVFTYNHDTYFLPVKPYEENMTGSGTVNTETAQKIYHTVKNGESMAKIASKYGLSVAELKKMNKLQSNTVKPKQRLVVGYKYPAPAATPAATDSSATTKPVPKPAAQTTPPKPPAKPASINNVVIYVVKKGDTMGSIAGKYGINYKTLAAYNNITNVNALIVGQKLKIPPKK